MDRRQKETRAAIFAAFRALLTEKSYGKITVQDIIDRADVGRTTFYTHFETKEDLLKALCEELFGHIVDTPLDSANSRGVYSDKAAPASVFCHLLQHLRENDGIAGLLSCESSEIFLRYFRASLNKLIEIQLVNQGRAINRSIPQDFLINHISGSFVEMVLWWIEGRMARTPEELDGYFRAVIEPVFYV